MGCVRPRPTPPARSLIQQVWHGTRKMHFSQLTEASTALSLRSPGEWEGKKELHSTLKTLRLQVIIKFSSEVPGSSRPKWNQKDRVFSLPEQKASFSGDITMSLALNSKWNLSWEPLLKVHWAAQRAASPQQPKKMQAGSSQFLCRSRGPVPSTAWGSVSAASTGQRGEKTWVSWKSRVPLYHPKSWMGKELNVTEEKNQGDTPHPWGLWTQEEAASLSLGHAQYGEGGLSPYPK